MSGPTRIELDAAPWVEAIDRMIALLEAPGPMMAEIGERIELAARLRFDTKTDPAGNAWAPLSPVTREIYSSDWFLQQPENDWARPRADAAEGENPIPGSLLQRTNQLLESLTFNSGADWTEIGTSRATKGGRWQIGMLHELGTRTMPRRGFLVANPLTGELGAADQVAVLAVVDSWLGQAFGG